ncbi:Axonemal dynein light chain domain-containing protein 1 [Rhizophlyctis rosea]|uniref:Axonemal dynein light chain domain-containing protein 1 n=1 Tax=Rhizophlyctis rosea TaxID=64517 RepID=A0AAD5S8M5_9FUNG|nr:Axonemal dynein light chain domain-containing protein 1 [Rhizophlyctis rosea]
MSFIPDSLLSDLSKLAKDGAKPVQARRQSTRSKAHFAQKDRPFPESLPSTSDVTAPTQQPTTHQTPPQQKKTRPPKPRPTTGVVPVPDNAFSHPAIAKRVEHLTTGKRAVPIPDDLTFIYDVADRPNPGVAVAVPKAPKDVLDFSTGDNEGGADGEAPPNAEHDLHAEGMNVVRAMEGPGAVPQPATTSSGDEVPGHYPSLQPITRKEVALLKHTMIALLKEIGADMDQDYPTEMHAFLSIIKEEQKIYDAVFSEIIRQVTINMFERGSVLAEIRNRYSQMFLKIPKHVRHLHTELIAHRKLNRRLTEELLRHKETVSSLLHELDVVRKHDNEVSKQAQDAQEKLVSVLTQSDSTDEILEEYHKLYKMQRDRLEEAVRLSEQEKRIWIDAATSLSLRIGHEHGTSDLVELQKYEHARLRATNHIIIIISNANDTDLTAIERKILDWKSKIVTLSTSIVTEDHQNIETVLKISKTMSAVLKTLTSSEPTSEIESDHPLLKVFHIHDVRSLADHLSKWVEQITSVAIRFTSDRDLSIQEEILQLRKMSDVWVEAGTKLLRRNERNTNGKDYVGLREVLGGLGKEVEEWLEKLERRVSGEDGIASLVISLQNQLEDRYTTYSARDFDKPLPPSERAQLKESLTHWVDQIENHIIKILTNTTEKEQHKIPIHVDNWLARLLDQLNTDTDIRNEENLKLHTSMTSWMVHLLVKAGKEKPSDAWDFEFQQLNQELISFNVNILRDAHDLDTLSDDKKDLRKVVSQHCEKWVAVARRLLASEKRNAGRWERKEEGVSAELTDEDLALLKE